MEEKNVAGYGAPEDQLQGAYIGSLYLVPPSVGDAEAITVIWYDHYSLPSDEFCE